MKQISRNLAVILTLTNIGSIWQLHDINRPNSQNIYESNKNDIDYLTSWVAGTSNTGATRVRHEQYHCDTSATWSGTTETITTMRVQGKCSTSDKSETRTKIRVKDDCNKNDAIATRVKKFDFGNDPSKTIFSHSCISNIENDRF